MRQPTIDFRLIQHLQDNGFTEQQATVLIDLHKEKDNRFQHLADKKDVLLIQKDIEQVHLSIEQLRRDTKKDIEQLRRDTKKDIEQLRADTKKEIEQVHLSIEQLRKDTKKEIEQLRADTKKEIELLKYSLLIKLTIILFALSTLSVTALTLWVKFVLIGLNV